MDMQTISQQLGIAATYQKKTTVFSQGEKNQSLYLVLEGLLKAYYSDEDGKEYIKSFVFPGDSIASSQALSGGVCSFSLLCLKETKVLKIPYKKIRQLAASNIETANVIIELLMSFAMKKEQREYELLCLSAEQRYRALLTRIPDITELIRQNDIALYLGITPVALSRIKHKR